MQWHHVYPVNDSKQHDTESLYCLCEPTIDWDNQIVVHKFVNRADAMLKEREKHNV